MYRSNSLQTGEVGGLPAMKLVLVSVRVRSDNPGIFSDNPISVSMHFLNIMRTSNLLLVFQPGSSKRFH